MSPSQVGNEGLCPPQEGFSGNSHLPFLHCVNTWLGVSWHLCIPWWSSSTLSFSGHRTYSVITELWVEKESLRVAGNKRFPAFPSVGVSIHCSCEGSLKVFPPLQHRTWVVLSFAASLWRPCHLLFLLLAAAQAAHLLLQLLHLATWPCNQRTTPTGEAAVASPRERHQASGELVCCSALPLEPWVGQSLCCARGGCSSPRGCPHHCSFEQRDVACFCNTYTYCSVFECA